MSSSACQSCQSRQSRQSSQTRARLRLGEDHGQATAEYALVLLGVAAVAMLLLSWARSTGAVSRLMNEVLDSIIGLIP